MHADEGRTGLSNPNIRSAAPETSEAEDGAFVPVGEGRPDRRSEDEVPVGLVASGERVLGLR